MWAYEPDYTDQMRQPPSDRYSMIGRLGEPIGLILSQILACRDCGAGVLDTDAHDQWHSRHQLPGER